MFRRFSYAGSGLGTRSQVPPACASAVAAGISFASYFFGRTWRRLLVFPTPNQGVTTPDIPHILRWTTTRGRIMSQCFLRRFVPVSEDLSLCARWSWAVAIDLGMAAKVSGG